MIKVAILDDFHSEKLIKNTAISLSYENNFSIHTSSLQEFKETEEYDIYFINPDIKEGMGMIMIENIRKNYPLCEIIIINQDYMYISFTSSVKGAGYLVKPLSSAKVRTVFKCALEKVQQKTTILQLNQKKKKIPINDLLYINIENRCPCYHLKENQLLFGSTIRGRFEEATRYLMNKPELLRASAGLIVNIDNIEELSKEKIVFSNKEELYLPRGSYERIYPVWEYYFNREEEIF